MLKYNTKTLKKLEELYEASGFIIRYEKGNFNAGYCILEDKKVIVINKYYDTEAKINCLVDISREVEFNRSELEQYQKEFLDKIHSGKNKLF